MIANLLLTILLTHKALAGSPESVFHQQQRTSELHLPRVYDQTQLQQLVNTGELVELKGEYVETQHKSYCHPWVISFVDHFAGQYYLNFGRKIVISSATRTYEEQTALRKRNKYAISPELSSHLSGLTFDVPKRRLTRKQIRWIINYLKPLRDKGLIEVANEPYCFHICVLDLI